MTATKASLAWSIVWFVIAAIVGAAFGIGRDADAAIDFFTAYFLEKSLSVDNLFVFMMLFRQFEVPTADQHRVLKWGVIGAIVFRGLAILGGIELVRHFHFIMYVFGVLLLYMGVRMLVTRDDSSLPSDGGRLARALKRVIPLSGTFDGSRFFTRDKGRIVGTTLLLVLLMVELSDVLFAFDSLPAVFGVTEDIGIVFTSNLLAVLGLRSLYFVLVDFAKRLHYLTTGLGIILCLIGVKALTAHLIPLPAWFSALATLAVLFATIAASLLHRTARPAQLH